MNEMYEAEPAVVLKAAAALREGRAVMIHDSAARENEVDLVYPAIHCGPESISHLRSAAGGLICSAIGNDVARAVGLPFMHDVLAWAAASYPVLSSIIETDTPYGGKPAFSITLNHRNSFTGVTDADRSATVKAIGRVAEIVAGGKGDAGRQFASTLKAPGHVPLLIEAPGGLAERRGHTELSIRLMRIAGLPPASVVCEMLDARTHRSLGLEDAGQYARDNGLILVEGSHLH